MPTYFDLLKYAKTGIESPDMTHFDKMRALAIGGGFPVNTIEGVPPISFTGDGKPLISVDVFGNARQTGTPSPQNIIMPDLVGVLDDANWKIPITCASQTVPVYLGQTQTVRRVKKLVLTGNEPDIQKYAFQNTDGFNVRSILDTSYNRANGLCTHYQVSTLGYNNVLWIGVNSANLFFVGIGTALGITEVEDFRTWLAQQYAAGTPVTVWYVLATPQTGIVNEPLAKIGDYADELHSADAGIIIPTAKGENVLTVDTDLQPSSVSITGHIK